MLKGSENKQAGTGNVSVHPLPDDVLITPAGGASEAGYIATFMIGQDLNVVVLLIPTAREKTLATAS
jgi:hypothetical protein